MQLVKDDGPFKEKVYKWVDPTSKETYFIKEYSTEKMS